VRFVFSGLLVLAALAWSPQAHADCAQLYTGAQFADDLSLMRLSLSNLDEVTFGTAGKRLEAGLPCLSGTASPQVMASAYRYIGAWHFLVNNDPERAGRWFRTSLEIDPTYAWDATELELGHPLRAAFDQQREAALSDPVPVEGKTLYRPAGSTLTLDGRALTVAAATVDRPHVVQQVGEDRSVRGNWIIEGNALPPQFLRDAMAPEPPSEDTGKPKGPKGKPAVTNAATDGQPIKVERLRPSEKTPLMIGGIVAVLGAGGVYAASFATRTQFEQATTFEDLERTRDLTNTLVLASGGVLAVGIGVSAWGIALDGGAGVGVALPF
jgi:hypothetical protein